MTDRELRRLSRRDLLDIIHQLKQEEAELTRRLEETERTLQNREIQIANAGSIAEAAQALSGIFEAAQAAADDYLKSVRTEEATPEACQMPKKDDADSQEP